MCLAWDETVVTDICAEASSLRRGARMFNINSLYFSSALFFFYEGEPEQEEVPNRHFPSKTVNFRKNDSEIFQ